MSNNLTQLEISSGLFEVKMNFEDIKVNKSEIESSLGYSPGKIPSHFSDQVQTVLSQLSQYCKIRAGYRILTLNEPIDVNDGLYIGNIYFDMQKIVTKQLRKSELVALFICTIGPQMEDWTKKFLVGGDVLMSYIVDIIASVTVESVCDVLHNHINILMQMQGNKITNRYSPGYCNWSVSEQKKLFSFFPKDFCGVTLKESSLMVPIKSVSGIIGIGADVKRIDYLCDTCGIKDCTYRATREAGAKHFIKGYRS